VAPLRRVDIHDALPTDLRGLDAVVYTPTFVLMQDGAELGRILGYGGEDHFWGLLGILLERLETTAPKQACRGRGGERTADSNDGGVRRC
jgi:hypothetical protein